MDQWARVDEERSTSNSLEAPSVKLLCTFDRYGERSTFCSVREQSFGDQEQSFKTCPSSLGLEGMERHDAEDETDEREVERVLQVSLSDHSLR